MLPNGVFADDASYLAYLRDWFAGQVIGQVLAIYRVDNGAGLGLEHFYSNVPVHAYRLADAMLAERAKGGDA